ncbi:methionyl-tRNA formyltransferase [Haliovirga abyssi]|uniref:Methionyl-tRNA formyltransferase n=1 Tax=Haliovirga abyssi TaxID=2996794 RepID=A0AAU9DD87_9FUSO|nr:methionyl-tRNA formyltransferase [Haliovirga abyssi]BDU50282.1 methionyl-tRNA formyltransferase [Haliovirga abyssi]
MRVVFMGTPEFAVDSLRGVYEKYNVVAVFTQPDKPNSRGKKIRFLPVKQFALDNEIPIYQPKSVKSEETLEILKELAPDIIVVVAYGKILPNSIIDMPKYGVINVHGSLLPKYRGASPIHHAIINGEEKTGVTIMYIAEELDAGDMILKKELKIEEDDTLETIHDKLKVVGKEALLEAMELIEQGKVKQEEQDHSSATFTKPIKKEEAKINWNDTKENIYNFVRGLNPFPTAYTVSNGKRYKIYEVEKIEKNYNGVCGEVVEIDKNKGAIIKSNNGAILLKKIRPENKKIITGKDLINGNFVKLGDIFSWEEKI